MKLKTARKLHKLSQAELALQADASTSMISQIENGFTSASLDLAARLKAVLPELNIFSLLRSIDKGRSRPKDLVKYLNGPYWLSKQLSMPVLMVQQWVSDDAIPEQHWPALERLAVDQGKIEVSEDLIRRLHKKESDLAA